MRHEVDVDFEAPAAVAAECPEPGETKEVGKSGVWLIFSALVMTLVMTGWVIYVISSGGTELKHQENVSHITPTEAFVANQAAPARITFSNGFITICLTDEEEVWLRNGALKINVKSRGGSSQQTNIIGR